MQSRFMTPTQFQSKSIIDVNPSHCNAVPTLLVDVLRTGLVDGGHEEARSVQPKDRIHQTLFNFTHCILSKENQY